MIKYSKEKATDDDILVMDVRPVSICLERNTEPNVFLGRITPSIREGRAWFHWESRWGFNMGDEIDMDIAKDKIVEIAKGQYV